MAGTIASFYDTPSVLIAVGITAGLCLAISLFAMFTKIDFTLCHGILLVLSVGLLLFGFACIITWQVAGANYVSVSSICIISSSCMYAPRVKHAGKWHRNLLYHNFMRKHPKVTINLMKCEVLNFVHFKMKNIFFTLNISLLRNWHVVYSNSCMYIVHIL